MITNARLFSIAALAFALAGCGASSAPATEHPTDPLDSVSAEELYQRGLAAGQAGDFVRAEQYLAAAIDRGIPEEQAMPPLIEACVQSSRLAAALGHAEPYLTQHPAQWSLRLLVASIHMALGHHEHARDELQRVLQDAPEEPPTAHYFLGVLLRDDLDDIEAAREHFRRYLALAPEGPHHEEALMALPAEERGLPVRIESSEGASVPRRVESAESAPTEGAPQETAQDAGATP